MISQLIHLVVMFKNPCCRAVRILLRVFYLAVNLWSFVSLWIFKIILRAHYIMCTNPHRN